MPSTTSTQSPGPLPETSTELLLVVQQTKKGGLDTMTFRTQDNPQLAAQLPDVITNDQHQPVGFAC